MEKLYRYPALTLLVIGIITAFFAVHIPRLELDNNNFRFISEKDPARQVSDYIDDTFGSSLFILVGLKRHYGDVFDGPFLNRIREYTEKIEAIGIIDPVSSIVTADYITGDGESIVVEKLVPPGFTGTEGEIARLKDRILSWDLYQRALVSDDFSSTQILVPLNIPSEDAGRPEVVDSFIRVRDLARDMFGGIAEVYVTGIPVISATINEAVQADLRFLVPLVVLVVLGILFFSFRRLSGVILPLLTVLIAVVWSMGAMAFFGVKLSVISTVLPVILVAVGSAYGIHVVTHYYQEAPFEIPEDPRGAHRALVLALVKKIARPVFLAALTTFVGFLSFCFTTVLPIREFGFFASFGVIASFAVALTLIPSLLILRGPAKSGRAGGKPSSRGYAGTGSPGAAIPRFFSAAAIHREGVLFAAALLVLVSILGASRLIIDNVFVEYFKSDTDIYKSDRFIREQFGGSKVVSVVAEADSSEILLSPACLSAMDGLNRYLEEKVPEAGKTMGFTNLVKRINQVFNAGENPGGLRPLASSGPEEPEKRSSGLDFGEAGDFGFGGKDSAGDPPEDFGFGTDSGGDFGFGNFGVETGEEPGLGSFEKDSAPSPSPLPEKTGAPSAGLYTLEDFVSTLSAAARSGTSTELDAGELLEELKKLVNFEGAAYYEVPADPAKYGKSRPEELAALVSNYLLLLSGSISGYANDPLEPTAIKTTVQLRTIGESDTDRALEEIRRFVQANFPENVAVTVGGSALVEQSLNRQVVRSQLISVILSLALVFVIIALSNRSAAAGLIGIAPLSIAILINFAVMGFLGIKLNLGTSMIASLAVGIGIDYTIHYMEAFKRGWKALGEPASGVEMRALLVRTFTVSGKAIIINALSVGAGFAVLIFSRFNMLGDFGLLIALTMGISALVSLTVIPALLLVVRPAFACPRRDSADDKKNDAKELP
ncbi:MAG: MMPL family transporter [Treponema sp.]|jgi:predicted RND superfamily exporter protein|nr:MMPL family transporter [Treponema sp.]